MFASFSFYTYAASIYVLILAQTRVSQASMKKRRMFNARRCLHALQADRGLRWDDIVQHLDTSVFKYFTLYSLMT